jgi:ankyrin repeat protein
MPVTQRKRSFQLFQKLKFNGSTNTTSPTSVDECPLDIDKMILHVLDCLGSLQCVMGEYDPSRAKVFWGAVATIAEIGIDQATGHVDRRHPGATHLLRAFPNEQKISDGRGWLPLHWAAVTDNVDVNDIRNIARADPLATVKGYNQPISANPGHLIAAVRHPNMEVVRCLYNFYPRMACSKDNEGDLPLHYAARYSESVEMIQFLLQAHPAATKVRGEGSLVPLHNSFYNESDHRYEISKCLLEADPSAAKILNADGDTSFHMALDQECGTELLQQLIKAFPEGLETQNDIGYLPLHAACLSKDSPRNKDIVELLLQSNKDGCRVACAAGHLPIHIAAEQSTSDVLQCIIDAFPEGIFQPCPEDSNNTPLLKAIASVNDPCVHYICDHYPVAAQTSNSQGSNPLHICAEGDSVEVMESVYSAYPENIKRVDNFGRLPLHVFVHIHQDKLEENGSEASCLRFLLRYFPEAVGMEDSTSETPLSLCPRGNKFMRRMLLAIRPDLSPDEFRELNYEQRRMAMFLAFAAINADGIPNIFFRLRARDLNMLKYSLSYL